MSKIEHVWSTSKPPKPDVYTTRRAGSSHLTHRYWDGERWFQIESSFSRGKEFTWPKNSITRQPRTPGMPRRQLYLRNISDAVAAKHVIEWSMPRKFFEPDEVLAYLVKIGALREDWKTAYQAEMRRFA